MPADSKSQSTPEPDRLEAATDQAIAACGGTARDAVKALIRAARTRDQADRDARDHTLRLGASRR